MNLERKLSEDLTIALSSDNWNNVDKLFNKYFDYVKKNIKTYDKKLFKLNVSNYCEYWIQTKENKNSS